jgi:integrase
MFWHDQTKVGNYDAAIRIPERLYGLLAERQRKTLDRFTARYGYRPAGEQRAGLALFPTIYRSQDGTVPLTHQWFYSRFRPWVDAMDLGHYVPHQARHILSALFLCVAIAAIGRQADLRPALLGYLLLAAACCGTCETGQPLRNAGQLRHGYDRTRRLRREGTPWPPACSAMARR